MKRMILFLNLVAILGASTARAQLSAPNAAGVAMGMFETYVPDVEADKNFWITLGGTPVAVTFAHYPTGATVVKFPGTLITMRKGDRSAGTVGSVVDHVGFRVRNIRESMAKWKAAGLKTEPGQNAKLGFLTTPDGLIRVEILESRSLAVPIAFAHIHFLVSDAGSGGVSVGEMQAWYTKVFGAKPGKRNQSEAEADLAGVILTFTASKTLTAGTKGRALERINFEVNGEERFCKNLEASGMKFDRPCVMLPNGNWAGFLIDPAGTSVEMNEGLKTL